MKTSRAGWRNYLIGVGILAFIRAIPFVKAWLFGQ